MEISRVVSFDLFGTLVTADRPDEPTAPIANALSDRGVTVPDDWERLFYEQHGAPDPPAEIPLDEHVVRALDAADVTVSRRTARAAVFAAYDRPVSRRAEVVELLEAAPSDCRLGICSNSSVPGLVGSAMARAKLGSTLRATGDSERPVPVVTSHGCGVRKPGLKPFARIASALGVPTEELTHVGDDDRTDGGITWEGDGQYVSVSEGLPMEVVAQNLGWEL